MTGMKSPDSARTRRPVRLQELGPVRGLGLVRVLEQAPVPVREPVLVRALGPVRVLGQVGARGGPPVRA